MISRIALPLVALLVAGGCSGSDATGPVSPAMRADARLSADRSSREAPAIEISYEKWITAYPAMTGNTSYGLGTFAGTILRRTVFDNGVIIQLEALYTVTDQSGGHFTARIQGTENLVTNTAVLNGVITEGTDGWMTGSHVHVTFKVIAPCDLVNVKGTCFRGTIRVQQR
jgi:hypothetical protein